MEVKDENHTTSSVKNYEQLSIGANRKEKRDNILKCDKEAQNVKRKKSK